MEHQEFVSTLCEKWQNVLLVSEIADIYSAVTGLTVFYRENRLKVDLGVSGDHGFYPLIG